MAFLSKRLALVSATLNNNVRTHAKLLYAMFAFQLKYSVSIESNNVSDTYIYERRHCLCKFRWTISFYRAIFSTPTLKFAISVRI